MDDWELFDVYLYLHICGQFRVRLGLRMHKNLIYIALYGFST